MGIRYMEVHGPIKMKGGSGADGLGQCNLRLKTRAGQGKDESKRGWMAAKARRPGKRLSCRCEAACLTSRH